MVFNGISSIQTDGGDLIVLADYGREGLSVVKQCKTVEELRTFITNNPNGQPITVVKLVEFSFFERND